MTTIREQDLLPVTNGTVARLPLTVSAQGCLDAETVCDAIAIGNYANDHHYPSGDISLAPKSLRWGGRWTGTPFTIPYRALISESVDGFLVCEKNFSVSHIANGATRLQPVILGVGQAAGMAAALCLEQGCEPRNLPVRSLQNALISDAIAPVAVIPLFNLPPSHPQWSFWQHYYLDHPENYPTHGQAPLKETTDSEALLHPQTAADSPHQVQIQGTFIRRDTQNYGIKVHSPELYSDKELDLVTLQPQVNEHLLRLPPHYPIGVTGRINRSGNWVLVNAIESLNH